MFEWCSERLCFSKLLGRLCGGRHQWRRQRDSCLILCPSLRKTLQRCVKNDANTKWNRREREREKERETEQGDTFKCLPTTKKTFDPWRPAQKQREKLRNEGHKESGRINKPYGDTFLSILQSFLHLTIQQQSSCSVRKNNRSKLQIGGWCCFIESFGIKLSSVSETVCTISLVTFEFGSQCSHVIRKPSKRTDKRANGNKKLRQEKELRKRLSQSQSQSESLSAAASNDLLKCRKRRNRKWLREKKKSKKPKDYFHKMVSFFLSFRPFFLLTLFSGNVHFYFPRWFHLSCGFASRTFFASLNSTELVALCFSSCFCSFFVFCFSLLFVFVCFFVRTWWSNNEDFWLESFFRSVHR